jgi:hypothetical protein
MYIASLQKFWIRNEYSDITAWSLSRMSRHKRLPRHKISGIIQLLSHWMKRKTVLKDSPSLPTVTFPFQTPLPCINKTKEHELTGNAEWGFFDSLSTLGTQGTTNIRFATGKENSAFIMLQKLRMSC